MKRYAIGLNVIITVMLIGGPAQAGVSLLNEDWSSASFSTNGWTAEGNWKISNYMADFGWSPQVINYEYNLTSNTIASAGYTSAWLDYDVSLSNYDKSTLEQFSVNVYDGSAWQQVALYDNRNDSFNFIHESINISAYAATAGNDLQLKFTASGVNSYNINHWYLDNIEVVANTTVPAPGAVLLGGLGIGLVGCLKKRKSL